MAVRCPHLAVAQVVILFDIIMKRTPFPTSLTPHRLTSKPIQGFPNWAPPDFVVAAAHDAIADGFHQYTRTAGHPRLVELLAERYSAHFGREVNPLTEVWGGGGLLLGYI